MAAAKRVFTREPGAQKDLILRFRELTELLLASSSDLLGDGLMPLPAVQ